jgi:predicted nuclease of predicted toxin-antitoxin system
MRARSRCVRPVEAAHRRIALGSDHSQLQAAGHDAVHVGELGLGGADDEQVVAAAAEGRILVFADTDFGSRLALSHRRAPSVVVLRRAPHGLDGQAGLLISSLVELEGPLGEGAAVSLLPGHAPVRRLPIGG